LTALLAALKFRRETRQERGKFFHTLLNPECRVFHAHFSRSTALIPCHSTLTPFPRFPLLQADPRQAVGAREFPDTEIKELQPVQAKVGLQMTDTFFQRYSCQRPQADR